MKFQSLATFGIFAGNNILYEGSLHSCENEAVRIILNGEWNSISISTYKRAGGYVTEITPVLNYRLVNGETRITTPLNDNLLPRRRTLIEIKDIVDEVLECDCLIDESEFDTVRCNIGGGTLWFCDLLKLQKFFDIKSVISEGDNLAVLIRNL